MTSKFLGFFRRKNGNKENEHPTELDRDMSYRRSARSSSGSKASRRERSTRFASPDNEDFICPTAPYHTVTAPKLHKGPQSCPGGYREDFRHDDMNRSFETEIQTRRDRREKHDNYRDKYRRSNRDTSEYGSGDPSPIGNFGRHPHYTSELLEDSDNEEYEYSVKMAQMEEACSRFKSRLKHAEERHFYYKDQCKKLMRAKDETERAFLNQIETMKKENQKANHRVKSLEQQLHQMRMVQTGGPFGSLTTGQFGAPSGQFAPFPLSAPTNRLSMLPPMSSLQSNTTTPVTSAMGSINGAGEALTETSDVSCLQPPNMYDSSFNSRQADSEEVDEMKNFRAEESSYFGMETPRAQESSSSMVKRAHTPTLSDQPDVEGSTTTVTEPRVQMAEGVLLKRSASDGIVTQHEMRHTTL